MPAGPFAPFAAEPFCYLTTTGRTSGEPRTIEIWFGTEGDTLYLLTREHAHWVRNLRKHPLAMVRIAGREFSVTGRIVGDPVEDALARRLLLAKYQGDLAEWGRTALPVALDARV
ncbi:MAG: nitroreductase family deazaflavin-dependent oxidoreductase [Anaerolineaceae bacterium]